MPDACFEETLLTLLQVTKVLRRNQWKDFIRNFSFFIQGGDLFDAIVEATKFTEQNASHMVKDLVSAVKYLHSMHIVHRDIKPENLLVSSNFIVDLSKNIFYEKIAFPYLLQIPFELQDGIRLANNILKENKKNFIKLVLSFLILDLY